MDNSLFQLIEEPAGHVLRFTIPASIDTLAIDGLIADVLASLEPQSDQRWVVDLSEVSYMGSSMLGLMVNIRERIRRSGGRLALCGMSAQLSQIFQTCCLERLFTIARTREEAFKRAR